MTKKISKFKGYRRLFIPVEMTKKGREMFPAGAPTGILVRYAGDGRMVVIRDGNKMPDYWGKGFWRKIKTSIKST